METTQGRGALHVPPGEGRSFWLLGEFEFMVGDGTVRAPAGTFVHAPKGIPHTYKNVGTTPGRYVTMIRPAGFEEFFFEVSEPAEDPSAPPPDPDQEVIERIMAAAPKYGLEILPPPEQ